MKLVKNRCFYLIVHSSLLYLPVVYLESVIEAYRDSTLCFCILILLSSVRQVFTNVNIMQLIKSIKHTETIKHQGLESYNIFQKK